MQGHHYVKLVTEFFILLNPFVLIPVFLALVQGMTKSQRLKIAMTTSVSVFIIMTVSIFTGKYLLSFFGITADDLRVAGGILIMLLAISMCRAQEEDTRHSQKEHEAAKTKDTNIGVVPLAIPLMAGPAAISTAIIEGATYNSITGRTVLVAIILALSGLLWLAMLLAEEIGRFLGYNGQKVLSRLMGLILLALSVEFLSKGIKAIFNLSG